MEILLGIVFLYQKKTPEFPRIYPKFQTRSAPTYIVHNTEFYFKSLYLINNFNIFFSYHYPLAVTPAPVAPIGPVAPTAPVSPAVPFSKPFRTPKAFKAFKNHFAFSGFGKKK